MSRRVVDFASGRKGGAGNEHLLPRHRLAGGRHPAVTVHLVVEVGRASVGRAPRAGHGGPAVDLEPRRAVALGADVGGVGGGPRRPGADRGHHRRRARRRRSRPTDRHGDDEAGIRVLRRRRRRGPGRVEHLAAGPAHDRRGDLGGAVRLQGARPGPGAHYGPVTARDRRRPGHGRRDGHRPRHAGGDHVLILQPEPARPSGHLSPDHQRASPGATFDDPDHPHERRPVVHRPDPGADLGDDADHTDPEADPRRDDRHQPAAHLDVHLPADDLAADDQHACLRRLVDAGDQRSATPDDLHHVPHDDDVHVDDVHHEALRSMPTGTDANHEQRPVLFVLDHDRTSLAVLLADLTRRFGKDFIVRGEHSPHDAVIAMRELATADEPVALMLVDDDSSDFLAQAHELYPRAKRVLLVDRDYSSTSPAVQAIALGRADYHLVRPWADDEMMYRAMSEFLSSWMKEQEPNFELFRIVAEEGDSRMLQLRDVLTRFNLPFGFYPLQGEAGRQLLDEAGVDGSRLPVMIRYDGQVTMDPSLPDLARVIGVRVDNDIDTCELAVVGAGPAGLTAAVYAASEGLDTVLLEQAISGGQAGTSPLIRNYPGFPHGINGGDLMERTCEQAWLMGAHIVFSQQVVALARCGEHRVVRLLDGSEVGARAVVIATGIEWRRLGVPSVEALVGHGVFYGAAVGGARAMQDQDVFIVGAGNSAGQAAVHLARHARTVTLLVRRDSLAKSMSSYLVRAIGSTRNIIVRPRTEVVGGGLMGCPAPRR